MSKQEKIEKIIQLFKKELGVNREQELESTVFFSKMRSKLNDILTEREQKNQESIKRSYMTYPTCIIENCNGLIKKVKDKGIPYAMCVKCQKQYDAEELVKGWFQKGWITQQFSKEIIKLIVIEIIEKEIYKEEPKRKLFGE